MSWKVFADTMYEKYFAAFNDDVDSFVMFMKNSCEGKIFPFELVKKLEAVDNKILNENGIRCKIYLRVLEMCDLTAAHPTLYI